MIRIAACRLECMQRACPNAHAAGLEDRAGVEGKQNRATWAREPPNLARIRRHGPISGMDLPETSKFDQTWPGDDQHLNSAQVKAPGGERLTCGAVAPVAPAAAMRLPRGRWGQSGRPPPPTVSPAVAAASLAALTCGGACCEVHVGGAHWAPACGCRGWAGGPDFAQIWAATEMILKR